MPCSRKRCFIWDAAKYEFFYFFYSDALYFYQLVLSALSLLLYFQYILAHSYSVYVRFIPICSIFKFSLTYVSCSSRKLAGTHTHSPQRFVCICFFHLHSLDSLHSIPWDRDSFTLDSLVLGPIVNWGKKLYIYFLLTSTGANRGCAICISTICIILCVLMRFLLYLRALFFFLFTSFFGSFCSLLLACYVCSCMSCVRETSELKRKAYRNVCEC